MGLFRRKKYDGSAIRNAEPLNPTTLPFMNGPDLLGEPTSGQTYVDPRGPMPAQHKGGFFGKDGFGRYLAGALGDNLAMNAGMRPAFADSLAQQREQDLMQQRRASDWADLMRKAEWERQNPKPSQPTEFERLLATAGFNPEEQAGLLKDYVRNRATPLIPVQGMDAEGNKTMTLIPRGGASQAPQPHADAIKMLLSGQGTDAQFDEAYGLGAAARVRGAGSGQPGFR